MMGVVDSYCEGCAYLGKLYGIPWCAYSDVNNHSRGCKSGEGCVVKSTGGKLHTPNYFSFEHGDLSKKREKYKRVSERQLCKTEGERKRRRAEKNRELLNGKQRQVLVEFREKNGMVNREIASAIGVSESTFQKWLTEYSRANWEKLKVIGIEKPEGI